MGLIFERVIIFCIHLAADLARVRLETGVKSHVPELESSLSWIIGIVISIIMILIKMTCCANHDLIMMIINLVSMSLRAKVLLQTSHR